VALRELDRVRPGAFKDGKRGGADLRLFPWGQGFKGMAPAIDALEIAAMERKLVHAKWSIGNAVATTDPAAPNERM